MMRKGTGLRSFTFMQQPARVRGILPVVVATLVGSSAAGACNDSFGAWTPLTEGVDLFSLARPELNLPSAFNFYQRRTYRVEEPNATGAWDLAVDTRDGVLVLLPPNALGIDSRAGIAPLDNAVFEEVGQAPSDTAAYIKSEPVPAEVGRVYVVQTGRTSGAFGGTCVRYAKMEVVEVDAEAGYLALLYDVNPYCNDRRLIPPS
jgi:hypothetical protein